MMLYHCLPNKEKLLNQAESILFKSKKVNAHFHTPYSFSAFASMEQVLLMAQAEQVDILGINDFYTTAGYDEFAALCLKFKKFPLFNIEFMGLLKEEQAQDIRVNDPNNPGRTYLSGKGLDYPVTLSGAPLKKLKSVREESDKQVRKMLDIASDHLEKIDNMLALNYKQILSAFTKGMLRERHIAKAIRIKLFESYSEDALKSDILKKIYGGKESSADLNDPVALEGEIRSMLLKSGGIAYVKENPRAFLEISEIIRIILDAGGIPCYPVLLDDSMGNLTEFESDMEVLCNKLRALNVLALEFIPGRNKLKNLRPFVKYFDQEGFVITFGTEHNTPALDPLTVCAGDGQLDEYLLGVSYEGACVIAAHQYLRSNGDPGFVDSSGKMIGEKKQYIALGNTVIQNFINRGT